MNKTYALLIYMLLFIGACSTQPVENVEYFILSNGDASRTSVGNLSERKQVLVEQVTLPKYLDTTNLAMQLSNHQLYYSKQHFWAEPLKVGITHALIEDLNGRDNKNIYVVSTDTTNIDTQHRLSVHIRQFMPTYQSTVKLSGQYLLADVGSDYKSTKVYPFAYEVELAQDGYAHSVSKMRTLLTLLSKDILDSIEK